MNYRENVLLRIYKTLMKSPSGGGTSPLFAHTSHFILHTFQSIRKKKGRKTFPFSQYTSLGGAIRVRMKDDEPDMTPIKS